MRINAKELILHLKINIGLILKDIFGNLFNGYQKIIYMQRAYNITKIKKKIITTITFLIVSLIISKLSYSEILNTFDMMPIEPSSLSSIVCI